MQYPTQAAGAVVDAADAEDGNESTAVGHADEHAPDVANAPAVTVAVAADQHTTAASRLTEAAGTASRHSPAVISSHEQFGLE